ncbi:MAG: NADH-quinone oxidoreductase subunit A [Desulfurococcales archaeon]|nr:NADH-quinone oxidoreductase subunit A [Desulfurococcales archaeon]
MSVLSTIEALMANQTVEIVTALIVLPVILVVVLWLVVLFIKKLVSEHPAIDSRQPLKYERYEAGNPPSGKAKVALSMQYFGYLVTFLALEPIVVLSFIVLSSPEKIQLSLQYLAAFLGIYFPLLGFAVYESRKVEEWMWR